MEYKLTKLITLISLIGFNMKNNIAVSLTSISKKYTLHHEKPTLVENILKRKKQEEFWALKDINLTINKGEKVGIIGPNGAGKTTLLKIISGITIPTTGYIKTKGKVVSLIELSAGFHADLTGEENIMLNGLLIGMTKNQLKSRLKNIINFANIGNFIDSPFYTYSSGMALRLGFSIAIHANPDILILDEHLSVGDKDFRKKASNKLLKCLQKGKTIVIASHQIDFIKKNTDSACWLKAGKLHRIINSKKISNFY